MNPETISIPDCQLDTPVKRSSGKISFCLIPCLNNGKRLQVKLQTKFKIFAHQEDSFSLEITLPEEQLDFFKDLEKHLNSAAMKMKKEISKIGPSFARFQEGDFVLVKKDKSEQEKIYAKIYSSKIPTTDFSCRFWELCENRKKRQIVKQKELVNIPLRGQVVFSIKHLFCGNVKAITCIVDEVWWKKWFRPNRLLTTMKTGTRMIFENTEGKNFSFPLEMKNQIKLSSLTLCKSSLLFRHQAFSSLLKKPR